MREACASIAAKSRAAYDAQRTSSGTPAHDILSTQGTNGIELHLLEHPESHRRIHEELRSASLSSVEGDEDESPPASNREQNNVAKGLVASSSAGEQRGVHEEIVPAKTAADPEQGQWDKPLEPLPSSNLRQLPHVFTAGHLPKWPQPSQDNVEEEVEPIESTEEPEALHENESTGEMTETADNIHVQISLEESIFNAQYAACTEDAEKSSRAADQRRDEAFKHTREAVKATHHAMRARFEEWEAWLQVVRLHQAEEQALNELILNCEEEHMTWKAAAPKALENARACGELIGSKKKRAACRAG